MFYSYIFIGEVTKNNYKKIQYFGILSFWSVALEIKAFLIVTAQHSMNMKIILLYIVFIGV